MAIIRKQKRQRFNLVEVTLSIAVIGIGIAGVMSLFPIGFQATRDAIGENYATYAANQFLAYIARNCNDPTLAYDSNTQDFWEEYIDDTAPDNEMPTSSPSEADEIAATFNPTSVEAMIFNSDNPGLFRVKQGSSKITDFHGTVRIWRAPIENMYIYNINYPTLSYTYGVKLNVEISWPVEKTYDQREKRYFCIEIFRQQF